MESTPVPGVLPQPAEPLTDTQTLSPTVASGLVTGLVTNLSGGELPVGEEMLLHGFDEMQLAITQTRTIEPDGSYSFENIALAPGRTFFATLEHQGVSPKLATY